MPMPYTRWLMRVETDQNDRPVVAARGVLHGTMALYLARYLNVPPARIPGERDEPPDGFCHANLCFAGNTKGHSD
jgi:hypothetical protein